MTFVLLLPKQTVQVWILSNTNGINYSQVYSLAIHIKYPMLLFYVYMFEAIKYYFIELTCTKDTK